MSLQGTLNIGRSALAAQQAALQVTSNNISNAGNADYTRQTVVLTANGDTKSGALLLGNGVNLSAVNRQIDNALLQRMRGSISDNSAATTQQNWLSQIETTFNSLSTNGLSGSITTFLADWSKLASNPQDVSQRQIVLSDGAGVAEAFGDLRSQLDSVGGDIDSKVIADVTQINQLAKGIGDLNAQIVQTEAGSGAPSNGLRDTRDAMLKQLAGLTNISTTEDGGIINVYIGSQPIVSGRVVKPLALQQATGADGTLENQVVFAGDTSIKAEVTGGELGGLLASRGVAKDAKSQLDTLAGSFIYELNKFHSSGQGLSGISTVTSTNAVKSNTARLDSATAGLDFPVNNGSFVVTVTNKATGLTTSKLVKVDLTPGSSAPATLNTLAAAIGDTNIAATIAGGKLTIASKSADTAISFSQDTSGALAALGINTFFTGSDAKTMGVNALVSGNPALLAAAKNGSSGDNQTASAIAALASTALGTLGGMTFNQGWDSLTSGISAATATAKNAADSTTAVQQTLEAQRESLSGVSLDEESVNLMQQQRAFQGAARIISTIDDMMQTVLGLVR